MKIRVNLLIFLFIILFILTKQIKIYFIFMIFIFLHEMGHMIVGMLLGFKINYLEIMPFGTSIGINYKLLDYNKKIKKGNISLVKRIITSISGPIVNLIFVVFFSTIYRNGIYGIDGKILVYSNVLIFIFNLMPIYPLDGGRIIKDVIHIMFGIKKSYKYTYIISNISVIVITLISSILILYLKNIAIFFMVIYLWYLVINQNKIFENKIKILEYI